MSREPWVSSVLSTLAGYQHGGYYYPASFRQQGEFIHQMWYLLIIAKHKIPIFFWNMLMKKEKELIQIELAERDAVLHFSESEVFATRDIITLV